MKLTIEIPRKEIVRINAEGANRQMITKLIRDELIDAKNRSLKYDYEYWEYLVLSNITVEFTPKN